MLEVLVASEPLQVADPGGFRHWIRQFFLETGLPPYLEAAYSVSGDKEKEKFHSEFMKTGGKLLFSFAG